MESAVAEKAGVVSQPPDSSAGSFHKRSTRTWRWQTWPPHPATLAAAPVIYRMVIPLLSLDLCTELYQRLVFPLLGVPLVPRREYIRFDRHRLDYLDPIQKIGCAYCGYANGLLHFAVRIAAETEKVFCPIQHKLDGAFHPPTHHGQFAAFGDREGFEARWDSRHRAANRTMRAE